MNLIGEVTRHAKVDDLDGRALDVLDAVLGKLDVVQVGLEGLLKNLQGLLALHLNEELGAGHVLSVDVELGVLAEILNGRVKPVGTVAVLGDTNHNAVGEDLTLVVANNCMAKAGVLELGEVIHADGLKKLTGIGTHDVIDGACHERDVDHSRSSIRGRLYRQPLVFKGDVHPRNRLHEQRSVCLGHIHFLMCHNVLPSHVKWGFPISLPVFCRPAFYADMEKSMLVCRDFGHSFQSSANWNDRVPRRVVVLLLLV